MKRENVAYKVCHYNRKVKLLVVPGRLHSERQHVPLGEVDNEAKRELLLSCNDL